MSIPASLTMYKLFNLIDSQRECSPAAIAVCLGTAIGIGCSVFLNGVLNNHVKRTCDTSLYKIVTIQTVIGDSYGCVSRKHLYGPAYPLKD